MPLWSSISRGVKVILPYGPRAAFLYGWLSMLVTDPGLTAFLGAGLATYAAHLLPLSDWGQKGVAVAAIAVLAGVNISFSVNTIYGSNPVYLTVAPKATLAAAQPPPAGSASPTATAVPSGGK